MKQHEQVTYIAKTNYRNAGMPFGIKLRDRFSHMFIIGKTGTGKSTLLRVLAEQDLSNNIGFALFDPHGDLAEELVRRLPSARAQDLVYLNVPDTTQAWHFNPLAGVSGSQRALAAAQVVDVFKKIWSEDFGPRLEHLLRNVVFALLEVPEAHFGLIPRLLTDRAYRESVLRYVSNKEVRAFWLTEYERYSPAFRAVVVAPLQNKIGALLTDPLLRNILAAPRSTLDLQVIMDSGKVLLVNLSKGQIGEGPASVLGSLLVSHLSLTSLARAKCSATDRRPYIIYLDEYHTFTTLSLATMLSELRKYKTGVVLAQQYLSQVDSQIRDAVFGNVGTFIAFRVGARDASLIAQELGPPFTPDDLIHLPNYRIYLKLMINGQPSKAFSASTLPALSNGHASRATA